MTEIHAASAYEGTADGSVNSEYVNHLTYHVLLSNAGSSETPVEIALVQNESTADFAEDLEGQLHYSFDNATWHDLEPGTTSAVISVPAGLTQFWVHVTPVADAMYELNESVSLSAKVQDWDDTPITGIGWLLNDDPAPIFTVSNALASDGPDSPNPSYANFTINLLNPSYESITLDLSTGADSDTATPEVDYSTDIQVSADGETWTSPDLAQVTFAPGTTEMYVRVEVIRDEDVEGNEIFTLTAQNNSTAHTGNKRAGGEALIYDGVQPPSVTIDDVRVTEGTNSKAVFTVTLSAPPTERLELGYHTADHSAIAGKDYTAATGSIIFDPDTKNYTTNVVDGSVSQTISISILDDRIFEGEEGFLVYLTRVGDNHNIFGKKTIGIGTIVSDDPPPTVTISSKGKVDEPEIYDPNTGIGSSPVYAEFKVALKSAAEVDTYVKLHLGDTGDSADLGTDYSDALQYSIDGETWFDVESVNGEKRVLLAAGKTSFDVRVPIKGDALYEQDETFTLFASNVSAGEAQDEGNYAIGIGAIGNVHSGLTASIQDAESVPEGNTLRYTVSLSGGTSFEDITIPITYSGSASATDLSPDNVPTSVTIKAGETSATVAVPTVVDDVLEGNETLQLSLGTPTSKSIAADGADYVAVDPQATSASGIIEDQPPKLSVSISDAGTVNEGQDLVYTISLVDGTSAQPIYVPISLHSESTAVSEEDFAAIADFIVIEPGQKTATLVVKTRFDSVTDPNESVKLQLGTPYIKVDEEKVYPDGLTIGGSGMGTGTIRDMSPSIIVPDYNGEDVVGTSTFAENAPRIGGAFTISAPISLLKNSPVRAQ